MKKRFLCCVLAAVLAIFCAAPVSVNATLYSDRVTWSMDENGVLTISGEGAMAHFTYPGGPWNRGLVKKVVIEPGVITIGDFAFYGCVCLESVEIADTVYYIGRDAFSGCYALTSITIPEGVTHIMDNAFSGCHALTEVKLPDSVRFINSGAFAYCRELKRVELGSELLSMEADTFRECPNEVKCCAPRVLLRRGVVPSNISVEYEPEKVDYTSDVIIAVAGALFVALFVLMVLSGRKKKETPEENENHTEVMHG